MTVHTRIAKDMVAAFNGKSVAMTLAHQLNIQAGQLRQGPFHPRDMDRFKRLYEALIATYPARIHDEFTFSGREKARRLDLFEVALMIDNRDAAAHRDVHYYLANTVSMQRTEITRTARPLPLALVTQHLGFRKMQRTMIPFEYNAKFLYIAGVALVVHAALQSGKANPDAAKNIYIPTKDGLYIGNTEKAIFHKRGAGILRRLTLARTRTRFDHIDVPFSAALDLPDSVLEMKTTVAEPDALYYERWIYRQMHDLLSPAKESGLLLALCRDYAHGHDPQRSANPAVTTLVDGMAAIMNSEQWARGVAAKGRVHAPAPRPRR